MKHLPAAIFAGALAASLASAKDPASGWTLASSGVPAVALVSVKESHDALTLTFRNAADKNIAAFALAEEGPNGPGELVLAHDCFSERVGCFPVRGRNEVKIRPSPPRALTVSAVLFEDGATQGVPEAIQFLNGTRAGVALEIEREKIMIMNTAATLPLRVIEDAPRTFIDAVAFLQGIQVSGLY
jgi:hypothetical protein